MVNYRLPIMAYRAVLPSSVRWIWMSPFDINLAERRIDENANVPGALLPVLHALQEEFGYVDSRAVPLVARALNLSNADVHGVLTFYHEFRSTPPGRHVLKLCRAEACQSMGCNSLIGEVEKIAGAKLGETTRDGSLTLEAVYCLGNCALSPAALFDGIPYGRLNKERAQALVAAARGKS